MSTFEDKEKELDKAGWDNAVMATKIAALADHFAKRTPGAKAPFDRRLHANTTITVFLEVDGKGKFGDVRYTRPTFDARANRNRYDGKGVFVARAHLKQVGRAAYGDSGTFEMPLYAALNYGLIRGKEAIA